MMKKIYKSISILSMISFLSAKKPVFKTLPFFRKYLGIFGLGSSVFMICCLSSCNKNEDAAKPVEIPVTVLDTIKVDPPLERLKVVYHIDSLKSKIDLDSFNSNYSEEQRKVIYALNRIDQRKVWTGKELVVPDSISTNLMDYSPFPKQLGMVDTIPKVVLISQRIQAFGLYEAGKLIKWGPVSSGKRSTPTPNGLHYGNYKAKRKVSSVNKDWILPYYFNFMNFEGVGTHQYALPGYPASHACVRLYMDDAHFIYDWATMWTLNGSRIQANGTPFIVYGEYDYNKKKPWLQLADSLESNDFTEDELEILRDHIKTYKNDPKNFIIEEEPNANVPLT
ncbi:L,D-transpeptidase [Zunongwangia pacifica]|uniref:L,D-transpeptidase n=1 Tax=Zunongwangia pacifica TaxID=2911062 RepID=A0A9X2CPB3_9FLAO|nr:L,D-transpeptidase [Zunongwangia pacifica]MCL6217847.1 L,D-transpeptidase [Zunongwangia pacifica]